MAFNVGDRVIMNKDYQVPASTYHRPKGSTGVARADIGKQTTVEFDNYTGGHNGGGVGISPNSCVHIPTVMLDLDPLYKTISANNVQGAAGSPAPVATPALNVGDRVELVQDYAPPHVARHLAVGRQGTYRGHSVYGHVIEFDNYIQGHDGGGTVPGSNACLYLNASYYRLVSPTNSGVAAAIQVLKKINVKGVITAPVASASAPAKHKFEVGDRVVLTRDFARNAQHFRPNGSLGTVKGYDSSSSYPVIVEFDNFNGGTDAKGTVPGSKACLYIEEKDLDKISVEFTKVERQKDFFDHSDIFKPETVDKIWEITMGRPVKWPELPPEPKVKLKATASSPRPYVKGDILKCIKGNMSIETGDTVEFIEHIRMSTGLGMKVKILTSSTPARIGKVGEWFAERFEHLNPPASGGDNYIFAKRDSWTKEETDELWNHLQDICRG